MIHLNQTPDEDCVVTQIFAEEDSIGMKSKHISQELLMTILGKQKLAFILKRHRHQLGRATRKCRRSESTFK